MKKRKSKIRSKVTGNYKTESVLKKKNERLIKKFQYDFISSTSHQLRTPIAAIQSSIELLELYIRKENPARQTQALNKIKRNLAGLSDTLERITTLYKNEITRQKLIITKIEPHKFINDLLDEILILTGSSHLINVDIEINNKYFYADEPALKQILLNLIHNAIKFSPEGSQILIYVASAKNKIEISVKDEGIGIGKKDQLKLYRPFFRAKNAETVPGVGLGLAIVKRLVMLHKARITCISEPELGTEFKISIPQKA